MKIIPPMLALIGLFMLPLASHGKVTGDQSHYTVNNEFYLLYEDTQYLDDFVTVVINRYRQTTQKIIISLTSNDASQAADIIRMRMIKSGIKAEKIQIDNRSEKFKTNYRLSVTLLDNSSAPLLTCNSHRMDYHYRQRDKMGCNLGNLTELSKVNF